MQLKVRQENVFCCVGIKVNLIIQKTQLFLDTALLKHLFSLECNEAFQKVIDKVTAEFQEADI